MSTIQIPSFDFTAFYYGKILEALIAFKRIYLPEHTDESVQDPLIQALRAFACVGHLCNTNLDVVANESTLPTAHLPETIRNMLALIDYRLASASPSGAEIVFKLVSALTADSNVIYAGAQVATRASATEVAKTFEAIETFTVERSDDEHISYVFAYDEGTEAYTDYTTEANAEVTTFTPWASPDEGDILYIGHSGVTWDVLNVLLDTVGSGITGVWEVYDGNFLDAKPDGVIRIGSKLNFVVNNLLGEEDRHGTIVRVQLDQTGSYEEVVSKFGAQNGGSEYNYIETTTLLGQTVGEADASTLSDYTIGTLWKEIMDVSDGTSDLTASGDVEYTLPENLTDEWNLGDVNSETAYWLRYRIISVDSPVAPIFEKLRIDTGNQYVKTSVVQGTTQNDINLGTADGVTAVQEFQSTKDGFIDESETITVDSVEWSRVDNFLQSTSTDRHYVVRLGENDRATFVFGNGTAGAIPSGQVDAVYRYGITEDGNVGANTIVVDKSGLPLVNTLYNPRPAVGWQEAQSASTESLERAKVLGPASLRTGEVALGPDDVEILALLYVDPDTGIKPFTRAKAIEGSFGPKTIELVVVTAGGGISSSESLLALNEHFNGNQYSSPPVRKKLVANQEVTSSNYTPKTVNISVTVYGATSIQAIEDSLAALLQPETRKEDGVSFEWEFGGDIFLSRISHEIFAADTNVTRVEDLLINGSAANFELGARGLPISGTIVITAGD